MNTNAARNVLVSFIVCCWAVAAIPWAVADDAAASSAAPPYPGAAPDAAPANPGTGAASAAAATPRITALLQASAGTPINRKDGSDVPSTIGFNERLWVVLDRPPPLAADKYVLFLNGAEIKDLDPAEDGSYESGSTLVHALVFKLRHRTANDAFWKELLGAPSGRYVPVTVALGEAAGAGKSSAPSIIGSDPDKSRFQFQVFSPLSMTVAVFAIVIVFVLVFGHARNRTTLRDNLLPQLEASRQPFSLARCQMAFWFTLIFAAFVFLFFLLGDANTVTTQALELMGISGATALASVAIDAKKESPADGANRGLVALGLSSYEDVLRMQQEITSRQQQLAGLPPAPAAPGTADPNGQDRGRLQREIQDRRNILRTYEEKVARFATQGWWADITTDLNGPAIHRLQVVCWTVTLGGVFIYGLYRGLSMPDFDGNLLTLMGISSAGYLGFKYPEANN